MRERSAEVASMYSFIAESPLLLGCIAVLYKVDFG